MSLETGTYISDLVATNPVGATDPKSQGDDHIRLLKSTILATFAAITGAVTATHTEINRLHGLTGLTGTGNLVASASPTFTGTVGAAAITATGTIAANLFSGSGASLTSLVAANITAGGTLPALNGAALTSLNASNIASGSLADARLSANVPLLNAANTFTSDQMVNKATPSLIVRSSTATPASVRFDINGANTKGYVGVAGATDDLVTGSAANDMVLRTNSGKLIFSGDDGTSKHLQLSAAGLVTTLNADASEVGFKGLPSGATTSGAIVLGDSGKTLLISGNLTIPTDASVAFPVGTTIRVINNTTGTLTVAAVTPGTTTLRWSGTGGTDGTRTLASHQGACTIQKIAANFWLIQGDLS